MKYLLSIIVSIALLCAGCSGVGTSCDDLIDYAAEGNSQKVLELFDDGCRADVAKDANSEGQIDPLIAALLGSHTETAKIILARKPNLTVKYKGYTARDIAYVRNLSEILDLIDEQIN